MKRFVLDFTHRGLISAGIGPIVLAIVYLILKFAAGIDSLTVNQLAIGIFSLTGLAFIAGGMNAIYQIEHLPLMWAILIHGIALYIAYLATYLLNDWLGFGIIPIIIFTVIFVVGYLIIWLIIYLVIRKKTNQVNKMLERKHQQI